MKIIINRSWIGLPAKVLVLKNEHPAAICQKGEDVCSLTAQEGEQITIQLRFFGSSPLLLGTFLCHNNNEVFYITPTSFLKRWERISYQLLPLFSLFLLALRAAIVSEAYAWFVCGIIVLTALSILCLALSPSLPFTRKKLFQILSV